MMHWKAKSSQHWVGGAIGALAAILLGVILYLGDGLVNPSYDFLFIFRSPVRPPEVVIIYLDDASHDDLKQSYDQPWDRALHARLLQRLTDDRAQAVVFDIVFSSPGMTNVDETLVQAIRRHGKVFLAALELPEGDLLNEGGAAGGQLELPFTPFRTAAAGWGVANLDYDDDRLNRRMHPGMEETPSLAWVAAATLSAKMARFSSERFADRWLNYYGPPLTIPYVSYAKAITNEVAPGFFRDKIVFVGERPTARFTGAKLEEFPNPYTRHTRNFSPGVEIHATAFLNLYRGDWLRRFYPWIEVPLLALFGFVFGYGLTRFRPVVAAVVSLISALLITGFAVVLCWTTLNWFAWLIVVAVQLPVAFAWSVVFNSIRLHVEKRVLQESLTLHLSPYRVRQILKQPELLKPGAEEQEVSIMFTDIANFTRLTARMTSADLFSLLNNYYETALACIHEMDGTVINLIGDAIYAIWNAPFKQPDQQERAARAALLLRDRLVKFEASQFSLPLATRVGLHTGMAHVGNLGSSQRFQYTAVGDNVNLASRLEGLNKHLGTNILATRDLQRIVAPTILSRMVGHFRFKGFDRVVEVQELIDTAKETDAARPWCEQFKQAVFHFQRQAFAEAETHFHQTLHLKPKDGPTLFYLDHIAELRNQSLPADWAGEINLKEK